MKLPTLKSLAAAALAVVVLSGAKNLFAKAVALSDAVVLSEARDLLVSSPAPSETSDAPVASAITTLPSLAGASTWLNSPPLDDAALKGHVVVVDFWTFLCSNCQAALPYVRTLDADFRAKGLITIGVHTPELAPERDLNNVKKALVKLGVTYPVPVDPDFTIWNRFNNRYWPSIYVFDKTGKLRYHWDGEGDYAAQHALVEKLLAE